MSHIARGYTDKIQSYDTVYIPDTVCEVGRLDPILAQGVIAFSISACAKKGLVWFSRKTCSGTFVDTMGDNLDHIIYILRCSLMRLYLSIDILRIQ